VIYLEFEVIQTLEIRAEDDVSCQDVYRISLQRSLTSVDRRRRLGTLKGGSLLNACHKPFCVSALCILNMIRWKSVPVGVLRWGAGIRGALQTVPSP
jgi:hypothetical protein